MRVFKRGAVYWFEVVYEGKRIQRSTRTRNMRAAKIIADAFHVALAKGDVGITERKVAPPFREAMQSFLAWSAAEHKAHPATASRYQVGSKALLKHFKEVRLDAINPDEVERFKATRSAEKGARTKRSLRPATVNRELACLKALFNFAIKADVVLRNPVSRVKFLPEQNEQNRVITFQEQRADLSHATPTLRDVALLILETGMRQEEVYTLEAENVRLAQRFLVIPKGKTPAARRRINLTSTAHAILTERLAKHPRGYLFPCETNACRPIPKVNNAQDRAVRDSKLKAFRLYDLRHTWATRAAESGVGLVTLASMLGHSRIQVVMRYAHPTQSHQQSAMERIE
jgi:site-specific recombinase XerD